MVELGRGEGPCWDRGSIPAAGGLFPRAWSGSPMQALGCGPVPELSTICSPAYAGIDLNHSWPLNLYPLLPAYAGIDRCGSLGSE